MAATTLTPTLPPGSPRVAIDTTDPRFKAFQQRAAAAGVSQAEFSAQLELEAKRAGAIPGWNELSFAQKMVASQNRT